MMSRMRKAATVKLAALTIGLVCLSGCVTDEQRAQMVASADDQSCQSYGAQPGSQAYFQCRMLKDQQRQAIQAQNEQVAAALLMRH